MLQIIVSENYRNRSSEYRWLVRNMSQKPDQALAFKSVSATCVAFSRSSDDESGLGCNMIACCETAVGSNESEPHTTKGGRPPGVRLRFVENRFVDENNSVVETCSALYLCADGSMYGKVSTTRELTKRITESA